MATKKTEKPAKTAKTTKTKKKFNTGDPWVDRLTVPKKLSKIGEYWVNNPGKEIVEGAQILDMRAVLK